MVTLKKIHFISIGGSIMHSLAINLKNNNNVVTGSDDIIYDPAKSNLKKNDLLPKSMGYNKNNIYEKLDMVIVGMHTKKNNIELIQALKMKLPILSFPEFIRKFSENKQRIIIAGSHGKSTITSIIMHVLSYAKKKFDYVIGAKVPGFDTNIKLTDAPIIIIEGDEYSSSPLDKTPKFLLYDHHIVLINGISWDHANLFHSKMNYVEQFKKLIQKTKKGGSIIYFKKDKELKRIMIDEREDVDLIEYGLHTNKIINNKTFLIENKEIIPLNIFGDHNMQNISGAIKVLSKLAIQKNIFYKAMQSYNAPKIRLEIVKDFKNNFVFRDFAHSPSKVISTVKAVKKQFKHKLYSILELHTLSSLNEDFLYNYKNTLKHSDKSVLYYSKKEIIKKFSEKKFQKIFNNNKLICCNKSSKLKGLLQKIDLKKYNILLMSSGNFDGLEINKIF